MNRGRVLLLPCIAAALCVTAVHGYGDSWVNYTDETSKRLNVDSNLGSNDPEEKDLAWGDFDQDGMTDLIIVRKQPFTTPGRRRNVLLMNESGVLTDRTGEFMSASDDGTAGFLDDTNDRDVIVVDVDMDGWDDVVTSTAYGQGLQKTISHGRIYMNLGEVAGVWQGFRYEEGRMPTLIEAPNTCGVGAGDVTGNGFPDLYFVSYNSSVLEDHLLINDGTGFFTEENERLTTGMLSSGFGTAAHIVDMNDDGFLDIVKSENGPATVHYNDGTGNFDDTEQFYGGACYHVTVGDLNGDGRMDAIISDDGADRYMLNLGPGVDGRADFESYTYQFQGGGGDDGFGGNSMTADLNNDGNNDVLLTDVDVDAGGCGRRMHIYRNLGGSSPTLIEQQQGGEVVGIPTNLLSGTHDVAPIDINGDGWLDLVIARCSGTSVWMNEPPIGLIFGYPDGLPSVLAPGIDATLRINISGVGGAEPQPGTVFLAVSVNGSSYETIEMSDLGDGVFEGTFPALECTDSVEFYVGGEVAGGLGFTDPPNAPNGSFSAIVAEGLIVQFEDDIEGDVSEWLIIDDPSLTSGTWEQLAPIGSFVNGVLAAPDEDAGSGDDVLAFVTANAQEGDSAGAADVDGGPSILVTPAFDIDGTDAVVTYKRWVYSDLGVPDSLTVDISNDDGDTWVPVLGHTTADTAAAWQPISLLVSDFVTPTSTVRMRFSIADEPNDSITEAGIDDFVVDAFDCGGELCPADINEDGNVNVEDMVEVILNWGPCDGPCASDVTGDGFVNVEDLVQVVLAWGNCG
ncbi:MAG: FG-GAP-like repeat-containing protein [Planctomycetota bacterium]|jgi:hypothetical protein